MRVEVGREVVYRVRVDDEGGTLVDPLPPPTLAVSDGAGGAVTGVSAVVKEAVGVYTARSPARTSLDRLTATWTYTLDGYARTVTQYYDVVAGRVAPLWQIRQALAAEPELAAVPTPVLRQVSDAVEDWITRALRYPALPEHFRQTFANAGGGRALIIPGVVYPREVYTIDGYTTTDMSGVSVLDGYIIRDQAGFGPSTFTAWGTHGRWDAPPADLVRAAVVLARYVARTSNYPERATRVISQDTEIWLSTPSDDRATGLPEVDGAINAYRWPGL